MHLMEEQVNKIISNNLMLVYQRETLISQQTMGANKYRYKVQEDRKYKLLEIEWI